MILMYTQTPVNFIKMWLKWENIAIPSESYPIFTMQMCPSEEKLLRQYDTRRSNF